MTDDLYGLRPALANARQFDGTEENQDELVAWVREHGGKAVRAFRRRSWNDRTPEIAVDVDPEGDMPEAVEGDWIIRDKHGEFIVLEDDLFQDTFVKITTQVVE